MPGKLLLPECIVPSEKFGRCGIMVCGCFLRYGLGLLISIHGKLDADSYSTILDENVLPTLSLFYRLYCCYFQDDNVTCGVVKSIVD
ncbi:transposable element Tc1 transposase [Trichonephila clavata]|uniref:Transposable element Tc1 transposase n=1 Tax=Trichonephila clavata TaxID=2740835 RepID=A0A8X6F8L2_TRICU|nr:transposable element Tc1 transposase [Trichonephila clavata]